MPLPKIEEVRNLSDEELEAAIVEAKRELFQLRFQAATRQLSTTHNFKHTRHRIAQLLTVERERKGVGRSRKSRKKARDAAQVQATST